MTLPALTWKQLPPQVIVGGTVEDVLNAIYNAFQETEYTDGTTRSGSGTDWTINRYQNVGVTEAVYGTPPAAAVSDLRIIMAGADAGAPTPTMDGDVSDSYANGQINISINKNSGAFNAWDNAAPFTSGDFFGYWDATNASGNGYEQAIVFESQEAIVVLLKSDTDYFMFVLGAWLDPLTADLSDAESNGRLYGMTKCNSGGNIASPWTNGNTIFDHTGSAANYHCRVFTPGAATKENVLRLTAFEGTGTADNRTPSGSPILLPACLRYTTAFAGRMREIKMFHRIRKIQTIRNDDGSVKAYVISSYAESDQDGIALMA